MPENHTATVIAVVAVLFALVGTAQLVRGLVLRARSRRSSIVAMVDDPPERTQARARSAFRVSAVCCAAAVVAFVLVEISLH